MYSYSSKPNRTSFIFAELLSIWFYFAHLSCNLVCSSLEQFLCYCADQPPFCGAPYATGASLRVESEAGGQKIIIRVISLPKAQSEKVFIISSCLWVCVHLLLLLLLLLLSVLLLPDLWPSWDCSLSVDLCCSSDSSKQHAMRKSCVCFRDGQQSGQWEGANRVALWAHPVGVTNLICSYWRPD